jgi:hypothetical protein
MAEARLRFRVSAVFVSVEDDHLLLNFQQRLEKTISLRLLGRTNASAPT